MITFMIPLKTMNPLNGAQGRSRGAVFAKAARRKKEREAARLCMLANKRFTVSACNEECFAHHLYDFDPHRPPQFVTFTRLSSGKLDGDGLQAALKSVRDGIADALMVNDGSDAVVWKYEQKKCKRGEFGVEVTIS